MILTVRRSSGFPLVLGSLDIDILNTLEQEERYQELEKFEEQLRKSEDLKEVKIETTKLDEVLFFLASIQHYGPIILDFTKETVVIDDAGECNASN